MSAQPKPNPQLPPEFYVVLSDGRTPFGAIGPFDSRAALNTLYREFQTINPGAILGVATRRPAKGVLVVSELDACLGSPNLKLLLDRVERAAARRRPSTQASEEPERGRNRR